MLPENNSNFLQRAIPGVLLSLVLGLAACNDTEPTPTPMEVNLASIISHPSDYTGKLLHTSAWAKLVGITRSTQSCLTFNRKFGIREVADTTHALHLTENIQSPYLSMHETTQSNCHQLVSIQQAPTHTYDGPISVTGTINQVNQTGSYILMPQEVTPINDGK